MTKFRNQRQGTYRQFLLFTYSSPMEERGHGYFIESRIEGWFRIRCKMKKSQGKMENSKPEDHVRVFVVALFLFFIKRFPLHLDEKCWETP